MDASGAVVQTPPSLPAVDEKQDVETQGNVKQSIQRENDVLPQQNGHAPEALPASRPPSISSDTPRMGSKRTSKNEAPTPTGPRSVTFSRSPSIADDQEPSRSRASSLVGHNDESDATGKQQKQSLLEKLRALASAAPSFPSHSRSTSVATVTGTGVETRNYHEAQTPPSDRGEFRFPDTRDEGSDADADAEESAGEQRLRLRRRKKKQPLHRRSQSQTNPQTAPSTPRSPHYSNLFSLSPSEHRTRAGFLSRRGTTDLAREGVSEDEGRDRLRRETAWHRRSGTWLSSARPIAGNAGNTDNNNNEDRRPSNLRLLAALGGQSGETEGIREAWRRHKAERGSSLSAQRWKQIKAGLKMIGQRRKPEHTVDHVKSAELLAELASGIPAALIIASMFQRDEHGSKRIPILLEQLKVKVTDSRIDTHSGDRHLVFRIELEYGSGVTRMKWVIHRTLRDFANLHLKYKLQIGTQKYIQLRNPEAGGQSLPRFPRSAFPYLRGVRGLESDREDDEDDAAGYETEGAASGTEKGRKGKKRRSSVARRQSSLTNDGEATGGGEQAGERKSYSERQRKKLENYLQKLIRFLIFRPDSNRLCKFLELSALGVRLASEGGYHGKEGFLMIQSAKGLDFRRALTPSMIKKRHTPKWFLVRHSYIVCVDSPEEMNIYDVFLVDPFFKVQAKKPRLRDQKPKEIAQSARDSAAHPQQHHTLRLENSERKLRLLARNERQLHQFEDSIRYMLENTLWSKPNRFDSFAPVRRRCFAQWVVDGRDHMWLVSQAISQAKDVIYIHDWWLSPELYMRRPPAISQKWRLDRLLQRKAREGVKIFVIMYRNINTAIPIDSEYSKFSLLELHPNIFVQRSPNQFRQNTFFWAHHEKLCIVDHTIAFVGGIDLCFGRWDTPQHRLTDNKPTGFESPDGPKDADNCQLWPGKDYSNPRVQDFYDLDKPYDDMYDRNIIPRMPWHDISMHVVGQPARDLTRHFVQRWNYILRQRKPTRPTPFLLPPPDFNPEDLEALGLEGTCEVQILRSSSMWSTGTPDVTEHSIMNAYVKLIEQSEHFVYIENQFFISTSEMDGKKVENLIGEALVQRAIRAARNRETWRAVILIPLMPGFENTVDSEGGTSVRLIMQCQYRSICRGESSIFGRLRKEGIEPEDYIQFYSLRTWGRIGPQKVLVTEQLYIHAKCMIVDDRAAIIGSANINERSMLGSRDSEVAAIVRDTDMLWSTMNGQPYLVGRFPHTLRMRLMREHLGLDVDALLERDLQMYPTTRQRRDSVGNVSLNPSQDGLDETASLSHEKEEQREMIERRHRMQDESFIRTEELHSFNHDVDWEQGNNPNLRSNRKLTADPRVTDNAEHRKDVDGYGADRMNALSEAGLGNGRDTTTIEEDLEVIVSSIAPEGRGTVSVPKVRPPSSSGESSSKIQEENAKANMLPPTPGQRTASSESVGSRMVPLPGTNDADIGGPPLPQQQPSPSANSHPLVSYLKQPAVDEHCMRDPVVDAFFWDTWHVIAENNTRIYRTVFRCMPDSAVRTWKEYKEYTAYGERFMELQTQQQTASADKEKDRGAVLSPVKSHSSRTELEKVASEATTVPRSAAGESDEKKPRTRSGTGSTGTNQALDEKASSVPPQTIEADTLGVGGDEDPERASSQTTTNYSGALNANATQQGPARRRRRTTTRSRRDLLGADGVIDLKQADELVNMIQGHLVLWPYDW